jgi:hypothetical protein
MTKRALLVSIIIFAGVSLVEAQSPISPSASPEASASPAKKARKKKAEASPAPAASPEASASPAKTRGRKKAEASPAPAASPEASASPGKARGRKKAETSPAPSASAAASVSPAERHARKKAGASPTATAAASASPANPLSKIGSLFKPKATATPAATTTTGSAEPNATPAPGGGHGLVWVNTESHIYHKEGSRFYGKTKQGKYMSEADAVKEGDRASKTND